MFLSFHWITLGCCKKGTPFLKGKRNLKASASQREKLLCPFPAWLHGGRWNQIYPTKHRSFHVSSPPWTPPLLLEKKSPPEAAKAWELGPGLPPGKRQWGCYFCKQVVLKSWPQRVNTLTSQRKFPHLCDPVATDSLPSWLTTAGVAKLAVSQCGIRKFKIKNIYNTKIILINSGKCRRVKLHAVKKHPARETIFKKAIRRCESKAVYYVSKERHQMLIFHPSEFWVTVSDRQLAQGHCQSAGYRPAEPRGCGQWNSVHQRDQTLREETELAETTLLSISRMKPDLSCCFLGFSFIPFLKQEYLVYLFSSLKSSSYSTYIFVTW